MTVVYSNTLKSTRMNAVITALDADASPAYIEICTAAYALLLVTVTLGDPSFTESGGVITMAGAPKSGTAVDDGTAAVARIKDGAGNIVISGLTVGEGTGDIQLNTTDILTDQTVSITSGTIQHG